MTFQRLLFVLSHGMIDPKKASELLYEDEKIKKINYYAYGHNFAKEPLPAEALQELEAIVNILQILYTSSAGSPISDQTYDMLQENLVAMGVPRLTGSVELNDLNKKEHHFTQLRGTLEKIYYLYPDEERANPSRKYLHEWVKSNQTALKLKGMDIDLMHVRVLLQPKLDGLSAEQESGPGIESTWLLRGDTSMNMASDVTHILRIFDDRFPYEGLTGTKTEVVMTEEKKSELCQLLNQEYTSSRQLVAAILNSKDPDFRSQYLTPVPLRVIHEGEQVESIHPDLVLNFPTEVCELCNLDTITRYAERVRNLEVGGEHYPTDGVVLTILDPKIQIALGRSNNINRFEVAYKYSGEEKYSRVRDVEFYVSQFGYITPVLVVDDVKMKGRTINHISLSNKERFDELGLCYGDEVKVYYEIIPYATLDRNCRRDPGKRRIQFVDRCPECDTPLDLNQTEVRCPNPECKCRKVGKLLNYCDGVRIKNIGYQRLLQLYNNGFFPHGIRDLYKLKKHAAEIALLPGFGPVQARKMIAEIESKRKLLDWQFFGSIGIEDISHASFKAIFNKIPVDEFVDLIFNKKLDELSGRLLQIPSIGPSKAQTVIDAFNTNEKRKDLKKLLQEINILSSQNTQLTGERIVFTGCRPDESLKQYLISLGYVPSDSWSNSAKYLIVPDTNYESNKVQKARDKNIRIIPIYRIRDEIK